MNDADRDATTAAARVSGPPPPPVDAPGPAPVAQQLLRRVLAPLLVGFLVFLTPLVVLTVRDARSQLTQQAELRAAALALVGQDATISGPEVVDGLPLLDGEAIALLLPGTPAITTDRFPLAPVLSSAPVAAAVERQAISSALVPELDAVVAAAPVTRDGQVVGTAITVLPSADADAQVRGTLLLLATLSGGLLVVAVLASRSFARTIVRPIATLDRVAGDLAAGHLDARAPTDEGPPELRRLAATLNRSADRLQRVLGQQRRFVADASHQLRTPLTGLRLRLETAEAAAASPGTIAADEGTDVARLRAAIDEVDRLTALVGDLLVLARAEEDRPPVAAVDAVAVVEDRVATWTLVGQEQDVAVVADLPSTEPPPAAALPGALEQVLDNLLANALRVAPGDTAVEVVVTHEDDEVVIRVADRGPGLDPEQRERAFDRFWRAPGAGAGGSGLGLSIVRELVRGGDGDVLLREHTGGGLVAEVRLRIATGGPA